MHKRTFVQNSSNVRHGSVRLKVSVAAKEQSWDVWSQDADHAYIQSDEMTRDIYLIPAPEFSLPNDVYLHLLKFLYGIYESGDAWSRKLRTEFFQWLMMTPLTVDQAQYYRLDDLRLTEEGRSEREDHGGQDERDNEEDEQDD